MAVMYLGNNGPDGTCLGLTSSEKVGFFGTTPVVQISNVVDATDATTAITKLNEMIAGLETLGLFASS